MSQVDAFWDFSVRLYEEDRIRQQCLYLQDQYKLNVNLLLLCCFLESKGQVLSNADVNVLIGASTATQAKLTIMREDRKKQKGTSQYQHFLEQELTIEKQQQADLIRALDALNLIQGSGNNVKTYVSTAIDDPDPQLTQCCEQLNAAANERIKVIG